MHQLHKRMLCLSGITLLVICWSVSALGQTVNVTVRFNSSTNPDTLTDHHFVQMRGTLNGEEGNLPDGNAINWGSSSGLVLQNVGGDYWEITFQMNYNDTLSYKFWTGFDSEAGTFCVWDGWEGDLNPYDGSEGSTRLLIAGDVDTTLPTQFYNGDAEAKEQYWCPYETKPDSLAIYFRVNMGGVTELGEFDPATSDPIGVRGNAPLDWNVSKVVLDREVNSPDGISFWSGVGYISKDAVEAGQVQEFKFFYEYEGSEIWESTPNRTFTYTANLIASSMDTTIHWAFFSDKRPTGKELVASTITWRLNTNALEQLGFFDPTIGDRIVIDGAKGWSVPNAIQMTYVPLLQNWLAQEPFEYIPGEEIVYKYVIVWDESRVDPTSENYIHALTYPGWTDTIFWEQPSIRDGATRIHVYQDAAEQNAEGDLGRDCQFFSCIPPEGVITNPISITFNIDMGPATDASTNKTNPLFRAGTDTAFVVFHESLLALSQDMGFWSNNRLMLNDPDGDGIYSGAMDLDPPTIYQAGFQIGYTVESGGLILNGKGKDEIGRKHYQYIHPTVINEDGTIVWPSSYEFPLLTWKEDSLDWEWPPDLTTPTTGMNEKNEGIVQDFYLGPNYPNPFNAATSINYRVAEVSDVHIDVYNIKGQLVKVLVDKKQNPGIYSIVWNGWDENRTDVSSGIYFIIMKAGHYSKIRRMVLLR